MQMNMTERVDADAYGNVFVVSVFIFSQKGQFPCGQFLYSLSVITVIQTTIYCPSVSQCMFTRMSLTQQDPSDQGYLLPSKWSVYIQTLCPVTYTPCQCVFIVPQSITIITIPQSSGPGADLRS
jgi:hypothetical protein